MIMEGTKKQIKWANDIKSKMCFEDLRKQFTDNPTAIKVINFVDNLDHATFWIDNRNSDPMTMLNEITRGTLRIHGSSYGHTAKFEQNLNIITITWDEIVSDGHGGHRETMTEVIKL